MNGTIQSVKNKLNALYTILGTDVSALAAAIALNAPAATALLRATWTDAHADVLAGAAQETTPLLAAPKVNGLSAGNLMSFSGGHSTSAVQDGIGSLGDIVASTNSASWSDVLNYTGAGVLEFAFFWELVATSEGVAYQVEILIDGVSAYSKTFAGAHRATCPVGSINALMLNAAPGQVPFKSSIQIRHKVASGTYSGGAACKIRKTA